MHKIQVGNLGTSLDDAGTGEPVIFIHGLACGKRMWFHQMRALRGRYRVIAYDQRGHGLTDAPADPKDYSPSQLVRDLAGLLDALGIARASIVGFSLGGGPALGLAVSAPHRVCRLVLADVGAGADDMWKSQWLARRWTGFLRHILTEILAKRKSLFRMTTVLRAVQVPALIMVGRHDNVCRVSAHLLADTIPNATLELIDNAGHMAPLENPGLFTARLESFLAR